VLRYYEHLETKEIGLLMGIGETSVRSAISRGLEMLRSWLREETDRIETRDGSV
jgi:DNA-directed RNA polymerase specialized sigma24 family protein